MTPDLQPPRFFQRLLHWFCDPSLIEELEGDLLENFYLNAEQKGIPFAKAKYRKEVVQLIRPSVIKKFRIKIISSNWLDMMRSHVKIASRALLKHRLFSLINIVGLAVGMCTGLLIISMLIDLNGYDEFHEKKRDIYRITSAVNYANGRYDVHATTTVPLVKELESSYGGIEKVVNIRRRFQGLGRANEKDLFLKGYFADENFLQVFSFPLLSGESVEALQKPFSLVLTEKAAKKFFGTKNPVGESLEVGDMGIFEITGVLKDIPQQSHFQFEMLGSFSTLALLEKQQKLWPTLEKWDEFSFQYAYLLLSPGQKKKEIEGHLKQISTANYPRYETIKNIRFELQNLSNIMPGQDLSDQIGPRMSYTPLFVLSIIALSILISACFNYTNLSIARAFSRAKEVGVRKVIGAKRLQIFGQFITEAVVIALLALGAAYFLFVLLRPQFKVLIPRADEYFSLQPTASNWLAFMVFALITGLLGGLLPALLFSKIQPVLALKSLKPLRLFRKLGLRKSLNAFQFILSLFFIVSTFIVLHQYRYALNKELGFEQENILNIPLQRTDPQLFEDEFAHIAEVETISFSSYIPSTGTIHAQWLKKEGQVDSLRSFYMATDENYLTNLEIPLLAGSSFTELSPMEKAQSIIVNEQFLKTFSLGTPVEALGQWMQIDTQKMQVVGVVKDFHYSHMEDPIRSFFFQYDPLQYAYANLKISSNDMPATLSKLEDSWHQLNPSLDFESQFFDEQIDATYDFLINIVKIFGFLGFLAIVIASLGLLGMAIYTIETRSKEIGIRKVFGAKPWQLVYLLSQGFVRLLLVAAMIALPATYLLFDRVVLNNFAYRISISAFDLLIGVVLFFLLGLVTIGSQTWKAATLNPVKVLRDE